MRSISVVSLLLVAACGGAKANVVAPSGPTGTPFDQGEVQKALAAMPASGCNEEPGETFADVFRRNDRALGEPGQTELSFACKALPGDQLHECQWSTFAKPAANPCGAPTPAGDNPCAGDCCSGFLIIVQVRNDGSIVPDSTACNAPG